MQIDATALATLLMIAAHMEQEGTEMKEPNPGSKEALEKGCKCPVIDNHHGKGVPYGKDGGPLFWMSENCPLHGKGTNDGRE